MNIDAVIFDMDGTLIDSMGVWVEVDKEYLGKRHIPVPDNLFRDMEGGNSFIECAKYFKKRFSLSDSLDTIMHEWTEMVAWHYANDIILKPGVKEYLEFLKAHHIRMGVGTSNSQFLAETVLKANKVDQYFDCIIAGCSEIKGKPYPDIFLRVAEELRVAPAQCLVVEDVLVGVQAAKNADMTVAAVKDNEAKHEWKDMKQLADFFADHFSDLHDFTKHLFIDCP